MVAKRIEPKVPESQIQAEIKQYLQLKGYFVYKNHQSLGSHRGLADLTAIKNGQVIWIEVKTPKGRVSEHQEQFRTDLEHHGGRYIVARSVDDVMREVG
ncbi:MAG: VRR-NUC domain-containing protein [Clostridia bacterium]|nr:VRR-NUC domain-containing protein [Clostridia bacterium]